MMKSTIALKLDNDVSKKFRQFCKIRGIKYSFFVEEAIKEKLEQEELKSDLLDLKTLQAQEKSGIAWEAYLKKRHV